MAKPGDFLIGVLDFFAILLPGSMATWLLTRYVPVNDLVRPITTGAPGAQPDSVTIWAAFLLSSYVLGHFVFMIGSGLDAFYDRWRMRTKPRSSDTTFQAADALRNRLTDSLGPGFSTLKWCKSYIQVNGPHARAEIDRFEADSKFFRSFVVISAVMSPHFFLFERQPIAGLVFVALGIGAYLRYRDQRWKMTELCYATAVILEASKAKGKESSASETHLGTASVE